MSLGATFMAGWPICVSPTASDPDLEAYTRWQDEHPDTSSGTCAGCGKWLEKDYETHVEIEAVFTAAGWTVSR